MSNVITIMNVIFLFNSFRSHSYTFSLLLFYFCYIYILYCYIHSNVHLKNTFLSSSFPFKVITDLSSMPIFLQLSRIYKGPFSETSWWGLLLSKAGRPQCSCLWRAVAALCHIWPQAISGEKFCQRVKIKLCGLARVGVWVKPLVLFCLLTKLYTRCLYLTYPEEDEVINKHSVLTVQCNINGVNLPNLVPLQFIVSYPEVNI